MFTTSLTKSDPTAFAQTTVQFIERLKFTNLLAQGLTPKRRAPRVEASAPNFLDRIKDKLPKENISRSTIDITASGADRLIHKRPTSAGMQVRKMAALVAQGRLSDRKLQDLQTQLEGYLEKKLERFEQLLGTVPGVQETIDGLLAISEANDQLGIASQIEIEELVLQAEGLIAEGRELMQA